MTHKLIIIDDHAVFRCGLRAMLEKEEEFEVVGEASSGSEALELLMRTHTDIIILDISMPGLSAKSVVEEVHVGYPEIKIIMLSMHDDEHYVREFLSLGVNGYVLKRSTGTDLLQALRTVCNGMTYVDPTLTGALLLPAFTGRISTDKSPSRMDLLSQREVEVCGLLAMGYSHAKIASKLHISPRTVQSHRTHIFDKLEFENRADLVRFAVDNGLLD